MARIQVQQLARALGLTTAEALRQLKEAGFAVKTAASRIDDRAARAALDAGGAAAVGSRRKGRGRAAGGADEARARRDTAEVPPGTVVIKKYGNRRLYSTDESRYLTLEELEGLIRKGQKVRVVDAQNGEDLTGQVLTQIMLEGGRARRFPVAFLEEMIRLSDDALQSFIGRYLMTGLDMFMSTQREVERRYQQGLAALTMLPFNPWAGVMREWMGGGPADAAPAPAGQALAPPAAPQEDELGRLRARLEQLEQHLGDRSPARSKKIED
ncbi:MAG: translation initiation factor IF-2 N-terminal domain-containing protein [Pseudomonadota bacterium]